jgi:hypothetical protein
VRELLPPLLDREDYDDFEPHIERSSN